MILRKKIINIILGFAILPSLFAQDVSTQTPTKLEGRVDSPFDACKNVILVSQQKYNANRLLWDNLKNKCILDFQITADAGIDKIDPLQEGPRYLAFATKIAQNVYATLKKSRDYANCSASCFSGKTTCPASPFNGKKVIQCSDRKKEIHEGLNIFSKKITAELALSNDAPGIINVNIQNILSVSARDNEQLINKDLRDFDLLTPNPLGRRKITSTELENAKKTIIETRQSLEDQFKKLNLQNYGPWMSRKLMTERERHRDNYRSLIYEDAPIFSVIDRPKGFDTNNNPIWGDEQIARAFTALSNNANKTMSSVQVSLNKAVLEFSRKNGEAVEKWLQSLVPGSLEMNDLLFYIGMKNQVEEILKNEPQYCAVATAMFNHFNSKDLQNAGLSFAGSLAAGPLLKGASMVPRIFAIGRSLTGAEAAAVASLSLGATFLGDGFKSLSVAKKLVATRSGLNLKQEGDAIADSGNISSAQDTIAIEALFMGLAARGSWKLGKEIDEDLAEIIADDLTNAPEMKILIRKAKNDPDLQQEVVDKWITEKIRAAYKEGKLDLSEISTLMTKKSKLLLQSLLKQTKDSINHLKNPNNVLALLKNAAQSNIAKTIDVTAIAYLGIALYRKSNSINTNTMMDEMISISDALNKNIDGDLHLQKNNLDALSNTLASLENNDGNIDKNITKTKQKIKGILNEFDKNAQANKQLKLDRITALSYAILLIKHNSNANPVDIMNEILESIVKARKNSKSKNVKTAINKNISKILKKHLNN